MKKIVAYTALHYGKEYLHSAIQSVIDFVDEYHVLYATQPSHGTRSNAVNPDSKQDLLAIAVNAAGSKLNWHEGNWLYENHQREAIYELASNAQCILVLDSDEIWDTQCLQLVQDEINYQGFQIKLPLLHYWRSFYKAVMHDPAAPGRVLFPNGNRQLSLTADVESYHLHHFGYAQSVKTIQYKMQIHGHLNEFRKDCDWYKDIFLANRQTDCHPVGSQFWNTEDVNPDVLLPDFMKQHKNYHKALIE